MWIAGALRGVDTDLDAGLTPPLLLSIFGFLLVLSRHVFSPEISDTIRKSEDMKRDEMVKERAHTLRY